MKQDAHKNRTDSFRRQIADKEERKLKAMRNKGSVWFGLGMMGMVGWSIVVPAVMGALGGIWLDKRFPQSFSWTLTLLFAGLIAGAVVAWYWVDKEDKEINMKQEEDE